MQLEQEDTPWPQWLFMEVPICMMVFKPSMPTWLSCFLFRGPFSNFSPWFTIPEACRVMLLGTVIWKRTLVKNEKEKRTQFFIFLIDCIDMHEKQVRISMSFSLIAYLWQCITVLLLVSTETVALYTCVIWWASVGPYSLCRAWRN